MRDGERILDLKKLDRPVALLIDEIQNIVAKRDDPAARMLQHLHEGTHGGPLVPVLAGLAQSKHLLKAAGISRIARSSMLSLGALGTDDIDDSVTRFMDRFKLHGKREDWPKMIADWSDGWPMHLHNALTALADGLAADSVIGNLDRVDIGAVRREAHARRAAYCGDCSAGLAGSRSAVLARVMHAIPRSGCPREECEERIAKASAQSRQGGTLPEGLTPEGMFDEMTRKGLIQEGKPESFVWPIPSMRSWCVARSGGLLHLAALTGSATEIAEHVREGAALNARDVRGRTPLHWAANGDWPEATTSLLELGSEVGVRDNDGQMPLDLAPERSMYGKTWRILAVPRLPEVRWAENQLDHLGLTATVRKQEIGEDAKAAWKVRRFGKRMDGGFVPDIEDDASHGAGKAALRRDALETARIRAQAAILVIVDRTQDTWHDIEDGEIKNCTILVDVERPFETRAMRRDIAGTRILGEDSGRWSYTIAGQETEFDFAATGTGYASLDLACDAAMKDLERLHAARCARYVYGIGRPDAENPAGIPLVAPAGFAGTFEGVEVTDRRTLVQLHGQKEILRQENDHENFVMRAGAKAEAADATK